MSIVDHGLTPGRTKKYRVNLEGLGAERDGWRTKKKGVNDGLIEAYEESLNREAFLGILEAQHSPPG